MTIPWNSIFLATVSSFLLLRRRSNGGNTVYVIPYFRVPASQFCILRSYFFSLGDLIFDSAGQFVNLRTTERKFSRTCGTVASHAVVFRGVVLPSVGRRLIRLP